MQNNVPTIGLLAFPRMQMLDFVGPFDTFVAAGYRTLILASSLDVLHVDERFMLDPDFDFATCPAIDVLVVPGGSGVTDVLGDDACVAFLKRVSLTARYVTSVCTGSLVLGAAGLLEGYRATTHWRYLDLLRECGATPEKSRVVHDRNRITGGGVTAGIDFALEMIAELSGRSCAEAVQLALEYNPRPPFTGNPDHTDPAIVARYEEDSEENFRRRRAEIRDAIQSNRGFREIPR